MNSQPVSPLVCCPNGKAVRAGTGHCRSAKEREKALLILYHPQGLLPMEGGVLV